MENWDDFRVFSAIARLRTHRKAAQKLGMDQATVGRRIHALEDRLGAKLLERHAEGYLLTELGKRVFEGLQGIETDFDAIERVLGGGDDRLEGSIRIAAPGAMANYLLIPGLQPFLAQHPKITLQFLTGPEVVNLAKREADLAIRLVRPDQVGLQLKRSGTLELGLYAHEKLLKRLGSKDELESLPFVALHREATSELELKLLKELKTSFRPALVTHAWSSVYSALLAEVGMGILPSFLAGRERSLIRLRPGMQARCPIWIAYHSDLKTNARVQALVAALQGIL